ncbi:MAG TPA: hypothetical protein V6C72_02270 [Chroococcales cyanobacterium]
MKRTLKGLLVMIGLNGKAIDTSQYGCRVCSGDINTANERCCKGCGIAICAKPECGLLYEGTINDAPAKILICAMCRADIRDMMTGTSGFKICNPFGSPEFRFTASEHYRAKFEQTAARSEQEVRIHELSARLVNDEKLRLALVRMAFDDHRHCTDYDGDWQTFLNALEEEKDRG